MNKIRREDRFFAAVWNGNAGELESMLKNLRKSKCLVHAHFVVRQRRTHCECLHFAANPECVRILLEYGADPNARVHSSVNSDAGGVTPLICAAGGERMEDTRAEVLRLLLDAGAKVNDADDEGQTALHNSADAVATQVLLAAGADVKAVDVYRQTPLHFANVAEQSRALLAAGGDIHAKDVQGREPLHYAKSTEQALCLIEAGACVDGATLAANAFVAEAHSIHQHRNRLRFSAAPTAARPRRRA